MDYLGNCLWAVKNVFDGFRRQCYKKYKLDPAHFMTAQSLSWFACVKLAKVKLELITDCEMDMFIDKSLIGAFIGGNASL